MAVDKATVLKLDPGLSGVSDDLWAMAFQFQEGAITSAAYGDLYENAALLWVAHFLTAGGFSTTEGASGMVTSESVGQVSRTYANPYASGGSVAPLASTRWGRLLLQLQAQLVGLHIFTA